MNIMNGKRNAPMVRYVYTHIPGEDGGPQKTAVIKKALQKRPPKDLIQLLIVKKEQMYQKEQ